MAQPTYPVGLVDLRGETLALTTTVAVLGIPPNMHQAKLYVPTSNFRLHVNPSIKAVRFYDASASAGARWKDEWRNLTDRDTGTGTGSDMDASTSSDFLYVCVEEPISGLRVTIGNANALAATLAATYRKNDDTWATLTPTDGTDSGGATLAVTGNITWTTPTDWKRTSLNVATGIFAATETDAPGTEGHWLRLAWDATLTNPTSITELFTINRDTDRGYFYAGVEYNFSFDLRRVGSIEAILAAATATMDVTWIRTF